MNERGTEARGGAGEGAAREDPDRTPGADAGGAGDARAAEGPQAESPEARTGRGGKAGGAGRPGAPGGPDAPARFGTLAERYARSAAHAGGADLERLLELAGARPGERALDVATGGGATAAGLARAARTVATDASLAMLRAARAARLGALGDAVRLAAARAEALPFRTARFDLVACRIAPHHFDDVDAFLREVARVLRPGGRFALQDHVAPEAPALAELLDRFERLRDPTHRRALPLSEWRARLERAGLAVRHAEVVAKRHRFLEWTERQRCSPELVRELARFVEDGPPELRAWLDPRDWGTERASFAGRYVLVLAVREER